VTARLGKPRTHSSAGRVATRITRAKGGIIKSAFATVREASALTTSGSRSSKAALSPAILSGAYGNQDPPAGMHTSHRPLRPNHDDHFIGLGDSRASGHDGTFTDPEGTPREYE